MINPKFRICAKGSKSFQDTIKAYLDKRAQEDSLFAQSYAKEGKSIEECCNYIIQEVKKMQVAGLDDDEVYGLAVHYYPKLYHIKIYENIYSIKY